MFVATLVTHHDRVLLVRYRASGWELPGGKVHHGESLTDAAARECREESGLDVTITGEGQDVFSDGVTTMVFRGTAEGTPAPQDPDDFITEARWVTAEEVVGLALSDLPSRGVLLEWTAERLLVDLCRWRAAAARPGVLTAEARPAPPADVPAPPAGFAGTRARGRGEAVDSGHVVRLAEYVFADGSRVPYVEVHETHDGARPGRVLSCSAVTHLTQNVTDDEMWQIGAREGRPAPLTEDAQPITDAVQSLRDALEEGEHTFSSRIESRLVDVERAAAKLLTDFADVARELSEVRAPRDGGCECGYGCPYGSGCRHVDPPEPSALTEEEARAQWVRGYAAAVAAMVRWQGVTPEDALRDAGITVADMRGAEVFDHDIDVIVAKLSKGFISSGAIPPEVRSARTGTVEPPCECGHDQAVHGRGGCQAVVHGDVCKCGMFVTTGAEEYGEGRPAPLTGEDARITEIGNAIISQDNRATDAPIFIVEEKRRVYGFDPAYCCNSSVWIDTEGDEADAEKRAELEAVWEETDDEPDGWTRTSYQNEWHFVTACFTEAGCQEYIRVNRHNHRGELRIYAAGSWRNEEWRAVRAFLIGLAASRGAIPPEVRHGSTPKAQAMFAKIIALNGRGPNVLHEWTTHDGLPVCSRCGVVRRADRDTTCKGSLPEVQQRTIPPEVRPAPEEQRAPVQADHRRDPAKRRPAGTIAWSEHVAAWEAYARRYGTEQSAERIAERAGFGYWELTSFLGHEPRTWRAIGAPALAAQADLPRVLTSDEAHAAMPTGKMAVTDGEEK